MISTDDKGMTGRTRVERSDRELIVTRTFDAPPHIVFQAWTTPDLFVRWWAPKSSGLRIFSCDMDVRTGGGYRLSFEQEGAEGMVFFGTYLEVEPNARLVWTNEEGEAGAVTTVTFADEDGKTLLVMRERYPTKAALDEAYVGMEGGTPEQFDQLDALLLTLRSGSGSS